MYRTILPARQLPLVAIPLTDAVRLYDLAGYGFPLPVATPFCTRHG